MSGRDNALRVCPAKTAVARRVSPAHERSSAVVLATAESLPKTQRSRGRQDHAAGRAPPSTPSEY